MDSPEVKVTVGGKPHLTIEQIAARFGLTPTAAQRALNRAGLEAVRIGGVWDRAAAERALTARPGTGSPGKPRPHRTAGEP